MAGQNVAQNVAQTWAASAGADTDAMRMAGGKSVTAKKFIVHMQNTAKTFHSNIRWAVEMELSIKWHCSIFRIERTI